MSGRGGKRIGAGRPKGMRNAATIQQVMTIGEMARLHTDAAMNALVQIAVSGESDAARVSAATAILDRGYGKATQQVEHSGPGGNPIAFDLTHMTREQLLALDAVKVLGITDGGDERPD